MSKFTTEFTTEFTSNCLCSKCKEKILLEIAIRCKLCNREDDSDTDNTSENEVDRDSWDGKKIHLFCKECTLECNACEEIGCNKCVTFTCCDCGYNMCKECRDNDDILCGCYGECYTCGTDVDRGEHGWPCGECEKWYCHNCRDATENRCEECGSN